MNSIAIRPIVASFSEITTALDCSVFPDAQLLSLEPVLVNQFTNSKQGLGERKLQARNPGECLE